MIATAVSVVASFAGGYLLGSWHRWWTLARADVLHDLLDQQRSGRPPRPAWLIIRHLEARGRRLEPATLHHLLRGLEREGLVRSDERMVAVPIAGHRGTTQATRRVFWAVR